jgi:hypothetical protein
MTLQGAKSIARHLGLTLRKVRSGECRVPELLDPDLNKYNLNYVTTAHPRMSREEWERTYQSAWQRY